MDNKKVDKKEFVQWKEKWPDPTDSIANIIYDTDIGPDYDDTGVVVMLHNYANMGKVNILGMLCCVSAPFGAPYLSLLNKYYGRPDIPIGTLKSKDNILPTCRGVNFTINQFSEYESDIIDGLHARDATSVYRELLSSQPDKSVTILATGMLSNLCDLLKSEPDKYSNLFGTELVKQKVKLVSVMGGAWPDSSNGGEFNFVNDIEAAEYVIDNWPTPIVFSGYEIGFRVKTGNRLNETESDCPLRNGYHPDMSSWDLTSAMYAVEGLGEFWDLARGDAYIDGFANHFVLNETTGARAYLIEKAEPTKVAEKLEKYLLTPKKNNPTEISVKGIDSSEAIRCGEWKKYAPHTYFHGGSTLKSIIPNSSLEVEFNGSGIDVYGGISPQNGKISICIDSMPAVIVDSHSEITIDTVCLYSNHSLEKAEHSIKITVLNDKNEFSENIGATIDFFKILNCD